MGDTGVEKIIEVKLTDEEKENLQNSAASVKTLVDDMERLDA